MKNDLFRDRTNSRDKWVRQRQRDWDKEQPNEKVHQNAKKDYKQDQTENKVSSIKWSLTLSFDHNAKANDVQDVVYWIGKWGRTPL